MTSATSKLLPHRNKIAFALLCCSGIAHATTINTDLTLNAPPAFDTNEAGSKTADLQTDHGQVMLDLTRKLGKGERLLTHAQTGSCLSIGSKEPLFVPNRAITDHELISLTKCKPRAPKVDHHIPKK